MKLYAGIDLHSNNSYLVIINEKDELVFDQRLPNSLKAILEVLNKYREQIVNVVVESTYNWYWLVDGLQEEAYKILLAHPTAIVCYSGLKNSNDKSDARWLAKLSMLGILPHGHIYPKEERAVRELLRRRCFLVREQTQLILSTQAMLVRYYNIKLSSNKLKRITEEELTALIPDKNVLDAVHSQILVLNSIHTQVNLLEKKANSLLKPTEKSKLLNTVPGIGDILSALILVETGDIKRFKQVGNYASYCRRVQAIRSSNNKIKGASNRRNGNSVLGWVYTEAANFAIRYNEDIKRYYQRKMAKVHQMSALNAVAHKLARACYFILRDGVEFDVKKCFC
jgi:transposase